MRLSMDTETLARIQFAVTIMFHYIYPPLSIGLGVVLVVIEGLYLKTGEDHYLQTAKFWTKIFALTFALGVATGIVMEFEFGTNWATYTRFVGDVFGSALAAEGLFAFFLESGFLALLLFGWDRVGPKMHFFATLMVCLGAHFSAVWITVANSWMQTPAGYHIVGEGLMARAEIVDFWAMALNPSSVMRVLHVSLGCWLAGSTLVISVGAYYLLKGVHKRFAYTSLKVGLVVCMLACVLQLVTGDASDQIVAKHQPAKLAAMEGVYQTGSEVPIYLFGVPNNAAERIDYGIKIPALLSILVKGSAAGEITGLDQFPKQDWPKVPWVFQSYHIMIYCWGCITLLSIVGLIMWKRGTLFANPLMLKCLVGIVAFPQIANQAGWMTAEMGRYPWIVYGLMRISEGLSKSVTAGHILSSLILFTIIYIFLFVLFIYLLNHKIQDGPMGVDKVPVYHNQKLIFSKEEN